MPEDWTKILVRITKKEAQKALDRIGSHRYTTGLNQTNKIRALPREV